MLCNLKIYLMIHGLNLENVSGTQKIESNLTFPTLHFENYLSVHALQFGNWFHDLWAESRNVSYCALKIGINLTFPSLKLLEFKKSRFELQPKEN